jgi:dTDP-glucose 4,6-dehydratase
MKLLITGGAGFIGSNFIHYWLKTHSSDEIFNLDKLTYAGNLENLKNVEQSPNYHFVKSDILDGRLVNNLLKQEKIDTIVHFAAESHVDRSIIGPQEFVKTNVLGTQVLLDAALNNEIKKFHHISTDEVFGSLDLDTKERFSEKSPLHPNSPYAASKSGSDCLVRAYFKTYGLPTTVTNTSNNFGPYQFPEKLIPLAITNLLEDKKVPVYGDGFNVRDWLYVDDHCRAIDLVLQKGKSGKTYCIGGDNEWHNIDVVKLIIKLLNKNESQIEFVKDRAGHDRRYALDNTKVQKELEFKPTYNFEEYLEKTVNWYKENREWWMRVKSGEYKEYYKKQYGGRIL